MKREAPPAAERRAVRRREVLEGLAALVASGFVPETLAQAALPPARFSELSTAISGYAYGDRGVAAAMLAALTAAVGATNLARLARLASSTPPAQLGSALQAAHLAAAAETVVAALYSGVVDTPRGPRVITYGQALVWQALPWTKPNAFCGGETNYWASPPARTA